jgi:hypothetical protein
VTAEPREDEIATARDARLALEELQHEADVLRRSAQETRRVAERNRLAAFSRSRHRA